MAETSYPVAGGAGVNEYTYELLAAQVYGSGQIEYQTDGATSVSTLVYADSTGRTVKILSNRSFVVRGYRWESGADGISLPLAANTSGKPRLDRIVLRLDRSDYKVRAAVLQGAPADTPVAPALTQSLVSTGVFEVAIARVTVKSQAGTDLPSIAAADVASEQRFMSPKAVYGLSTFRGTANALGRFYLESDNGRLFVGALGGDLLVGENGPWTKVGASGGWSNDNIYCQRVNGMTYMQCNLKLNVADKAANSELIIVQLPSQFRPQRDFYATCYMTPGQIGYVLFDSATGVVKINNYPQVFPKDGIVVIGPFSYPSTGVRS